MHSKASAVTDEAHVGNVVAVRVPVIKDDPDRSVFEVEYETWLLNSDDRLEDVDEGKERTREGDRQQSSRCQ